MAPRKKAAAAKGGTKQNVLMLIGGTYHPFEACAEIAREFLTATGRYALTVTDDREALAGGLEAHDAVMIYTCGGTYTAKQQAGLARYVRKGGGLVAVHSANAVGDDCREYLAVIGSQFATHPPDHKFESVRVVDPAHQATTRLADFSITEELYVLKNVASDAAVLATTTYQCKPMPVMYARQEGQGRVFYTALGQGTAQWRHSSFQRGLLHGLDWCCRVGPIRQGPIRCAMLGYGPPRDWWRSDKKISGGNLYDWGAHFTDWALQLIPRKIAWVQGFFHPKMWVQQTNEDHTQAIIRFADGSMADVTMSSLSAAGRPRWRILGSKGAILDDYTVEKGCKVITCENGGLVTRHVKWMEALRDEYYHNIADHLLLGDPQVITPQNARRVISVIECAERSAKSGRPEPVPGEDAD